MSSTIQHPAKSRPWRQRLRSVVFQLAPILYCMPLLLLIACGNSVGDVVSLAVPVDDTDEVNVNESKLIQVLANDTPAGEVTLESVVNQPNFDNATAVVSGNAVLFTAKGNPGTETFSYSVKDKNGVISNTYGKVTVKIKQIAIGGQPLAVGDGPFKVPRRLQTTLDVTSNDQPNVGGLITDVQPEPLDNGQRVITVFNNTIIYEAYGGTGIVNDEFTYRITNGVAPSRPATVKVQVLPSASARLLNNSDSEVVFTLPDARLIPVTSGSGNLAEFFPINSEGDTSIKVTYKNQDYFGVGPIVDNSRVNVLFDPTSEPKVRIESLAD